MPRTTRSKCEVSEKNKLKSSRTRKVRKKNDSSEGGSDDEGVATAVKKPKIVVKKLTNGHTEPCSPVSKVAADQAMLPTTSKQVKEEAADGGSADSSSDSDWEEVAMASEDDDREPVIPSEGVQITLELPDSKRRRAKKEIDFDAYIRRKVIRFRRDVQEAAHKVHLLCLLAVGMASRRCLVVTELRASVLSLQPREHLEVKPRKRDQPFVERMIQWFGGAFRLESTRNGQGVGATPTLQLLQAVRSGVAESELVYIGMFLVCLLNCGMDARLVISLQPMPLKISIKQPTKKKPSDPSAEEGAAEQDPLKADKSCPLQAKRKIVEKKPRKKKGEVSEKSQTQRSRKEKNCSDKTNDDVTAGGDQRTTRRKRKSASAVRTYKEPSDDEDEDGKKEEEEEEDESKGHAGGDRRRTRSVAAAPSKKSKVVVNEHKVPEMNTEDDPDDDDFEIAFEQIKKYGQMKGKKQNRKTMSSDSDEGETGVPIRRTVGSDHWIEVYLDSVKSWICVDCVRGVVNKPQEMEENASKPMSYVLAYDENGVKDVTRRYASGWLSQCRKLRVSAEWWDETLTPFQCPPSKRDSLENEQLQDNLLERPLPKAVSEYKNHPLYVLTRHLLKFEGIYPPDSVPVGYIRGESVYARECVHTLHSRETWMKDARVVKRGETPYKVVKARPKWNRAKGELVTDIPLELFGKWQTEDYVAPPAENGIVPRNEYGNVELFKASMLPKGTVHLQLSALNRVAKKLGIDCARAMTGWDFHGVGSHPVFDGWVVCEEFKEVLEDAWREEQIAADKREREKREKRVYGNWRRLIRGLLIGERLANRYSKKESASD